MEGPYFHTSTPPNSFVRFPPPLDLPSNTFPYKGFPWTMKKASYPSA